MMSPIFILKCNKCDRETEIYLHTERAIASFKCSGCEAVGLWSKKPTVPLIPQNGTYSYREKK